MGVRCRRHKISDALEMPGVVQMGVGSVVPQADTPTALEDVEESQDADEGVATTGMLEGTGLSMGLHQEKLLENRAQPHPVNDPKQRFLESPQLVLARARLGRSGWKLELWKPP